LAIFLLSLLGFWADYVPYGDARASNAAFLLSSGDFVPAYILAACLFTLLFPLFSSM